jgi:hypothetical protein
MLRYVPYRHDLWARGDLGGGAYCLFVKKDSTMSEAQDSVMSSPKPKRAAMFWSARRSLLPAHRRERRVCGERATMLASAQGLGAVYRQRRSGHIARQVGSHKCDIIQSAIPWMSQERSLCQLAEPDSPPVTFASDPRGQAGTHLRRLAAGI